VHRFGRTERFAHWWTVATLSSALLSGLGMGDEGEGGEGGTVFTVHVASVILFGSGLVAAALFGDHRALFRAAQRLFSVDRRDVAWLRAHARHPLVTKDDPAWGMFNTGQKLLAWAVTASLGAVIVTGTLDWNAGGEGSGLHPAMVVVTGVLLGAHVFIAIVNPVTGPAVAGMVFGRVRRSWAAKHHRGWLDEVERDN
jgi:formate dehydrogenase subunit gamma